MPNKLPKWVKGLLLVAGIVVATKMAWGIAYPSGAWRYKLTVAVDTPEGVKTGSAVREVRAEKFRSIFTSSDLAINMPRGEAVVVDLGQRGVLYGLNKTYKHGVDGGHYIVTEAFPAPRPIDTPGYIRYYSNLEAGPVELDEAYYPMFVRFRDPSDPKTVENLLDVKACPEPNPHPMKFCLYEDRFARAFGDGVSLKSVTIEMTREPVTTGVVERYLPSYQPINEYMNWFKSLKYSDPRRLLPSDFGAIGQ